MTEFLIFAMGCGVGAAATSLVMLWRGHTQYDRIMREWDQDVRQEP